MTHAAVIRPLNIGPTMPPPPAPPDGPPDGPPIWPLAVVTGLLTLLPARVTDPRCGTVVSPAVVVTGLATLLPAGVTDPRSATATSPLAVLAGLPGPPPAGSTDPRCGTLISPTTPPSATNTDWVTDTPRVIRAQCSQRGAVVIERLPLSHTLCSSKMPRSFSTSLRPSTLSWSRIAGL